MEFAGRRPGAIGRCTGRRVPLPAKRDFFERTKCLAINAVCRRAVLGLVWENPGENEQGPTRLLLGDLENGKLLATGSVPGKMVPLALDDAGTNVLMCRNELRFGKNDRLEVWKLTEAGISKGLRWIPYGDEDGPKRDVKWAEYLDAEKLATLSGGGRLAVWNAAAGKPLYWLQIDRNCRPASVPRASTSPSPLLRTWGC